MLTFLPKEEKPSEKPVTEISGPLQTFLYRAELEAFLSGQWSSSKGLQVSNGPSVCPPVHSAPAGGASERCLLSSDLTAKENV